MYTNCNDGIGSTLRSLSKAVRFMLNSPAETKKGALGVKTRLGGVRLGRLLRNFGMNLLDSSGVRISGHSEAG
jgi:hypothetical protein